MPPRDATLTLDPALGKQAGSPHAPGWQLSRRDQVERPHGEFKGRGSRIAQEACGGPCA